jgi:hypothetical protein
VGVLLLGREVFLQARIEFGLIFYRLGGRGENTPFDRRRRQGEEQHTMK